MRKHRSAFIDPEEITAAVDASHKMQHHDDHMNSGNQTDNHQSDDPHNDKQFCVDISEYLDLKWVIRESEECIVNFNREKQTFNKQQTHNLQN